MYYFLNYCPILLAKQVGQRKALRVMDFPEIWEGHFLKYHYINKARENGHHGAELSRRGSGKAHPYDEIVYTPEGLKTWGEIKVGDKVFGDDGNVTTVLDIPFDDRVPVYELTFESGKKV